MRCAVKCCKWERGQSLFRFPKDESGLMTWLKILGEVERFEDIKAGKDVRICAKHFKEEMLMKNGRRLYPWAVPTAAVNENSSELDLFWHFISKVNEEYISSFAFNDAQVENSQQNTSIFDNKISEEDYQREAELMASPVALSADNLTSPERNIGKGKVNILSVEYLLPNRNENNGTRKLSKRKLEVEMGNDIEDIPLPCKKRNTITSTQTEKMLSESTPRKNKLQQRIKELTRRLQEKSIIIHNLQEEIRHKSNFVQQAKELLPEELAQIVACQIKNSNRKAKGHRYTHELKQFALSIYFLAPSAYNFLAKIIVLPSENTLHKYVRTWPSGPGLHDCYFKSLQLKLEQLPEMAKKCILCFDEMALKANLYYDRMKGEIIGLEDNGVKKTNLVAKNAFVIMAKGITHNYKHFLGYVLFNSTCPALQVKGLLLEAIDKLQKIGLQPQGTVCDQGANFVGLAKLLSITPGKPSFKANDGSEIFFFFDPPHLLKSLRNNLMQKNIVFDDDKIAKWEDIRRFATWDSQKRFRLAPKLSEIHINPNNFQKMKVKLATQVISHTVACGIYTQVSNNEGSSSAIYTAEFLEKFDNLFDMFNSTQFSEAKELKRPFKGSEKQLAFLEEMQNLLEGMRIIDKNGKDVTNGVRFVTGWKISIASLKKLQQKLKPGGINYILTRRLNQDALEHGFAMLRRRGGSNHNPTCYQFAGAFKKIFSLKFLEVSKSTNCEPEKGIHLPPINRQLIEFPDKPAKVTADNLMIRADYHNMDFGEENAMCYFAGWLLKKHKENHNCNANEIPDERSNNVFITFKMYENGNLIIPSANFMNALESMEKQFLEYFSQFIEGNDIEKNLYEVLKTNFTYKCCEASNNEYLVRLFIRARIHYILKFFNKDLVKNNSSSRRKMLTLSHL